MSLHFPTDRDRGQWQLFVWNLPDDFLSEPQKLQLMLVLNNSFNAFEPFVVVRDLLVNRTLWQSVVMDRGVLMPRGTSEFPGTRIRTDLIKLRDIGSGWWNVDTLFLLTCEEHVAGLTAIADRWSYDAITVLSGEDTDDLLGIGRANHPNRIIGIWWD